MLCFGFFLSKKNLYLCSKIVKFFDLIGGLDLIIAPGVAFTEKGERLGHGRGYYDRFLAKLAKAQTEPATVVALALKEQIVDNVPVDPDHDVIIDVVLYDDK